MVTYCFDFSLAQKNCRWKFYDTYFIKIIIFELLASDLAADSTRTRNQTQAFVQNPTFVSLWVLIAHVKYFLLWSYQIGACHKTFLMISHLNKSDIVWLWFECDQTLSRMYGHFIWGAIPMLYLCRTRVVTVSNLLYHFIFFLNC